ncbi:GntR family transcriptional regulator [Sutcliffiella horikoshii]|uniref:GntR family transcriptional regulator n=1 Tax=Sutcliffiella horikoshii TaxID=79883 RepID=A0A5D4SZE3_9BACI|nr:GntR family transcriptional regulator [Sutcliffiella horikoshii]TYS67602.1 GntR family transcriptional regulator [Sutcliffiella horikoshii]
MRVSDKVEKLFIQKILQGEFVPGTQIPSERELATTLEVGRPVIREVLQRLERDGWLTIRHNQRATVNDYWKEGNLMTIAHILNEEDSIPNEFIIHLLELRKNLSPSYVKGAVLHKPMEVISLLKESENVADTPGSFAEYDWDLQRGLAAAAPNPIYLLILNSFGHLYLNLATYYFHDASYREASKNYYMKLMKAALDKDGDKAEQLVHNMMEQSIKMWEEQTAVK